MPSLKTSIRGRQDLVAPAPNRWIVELPVDNKTAGGLAVEQPESKMIRQILEAVAVDFVHR